MIQIRSRPAFTLVEMLIVVVILGIIAAIVVPQFTIATDDAKYNTMATNLAAVRIQLQLYKLEHDTAYPTDSTTLETQLTTKTNLAGNPGGDYGPYMLRMPPNPYTDDNSVRAAKVVDVTPATRSAWYYLTTDTIPFRANDLEAHFNEL